MIECVCLASGNAVNGKSLLAVIQKKESLSAFFSLSPFTDLWPAHSQFQLFLHEQFFTYFIYNAPSLWHPTLTFINPQAPQVQSQAPKSWQKYQLIKMSHFPCPKKKSADSRQTKETENKPTPTRTTTKTTAKPTINIKSKNVCTDEARLGRYSGIFERRILLKF